MAATNGERRLVERVTSVPPWLLAAALAIPSMLPVFAHYMGFSRTGLFPTGFIIYDTPYYLANARELFDGGHFSARYANPFSYDYASPRIYFQPLTLLLGLLVRVTALDPGIVFTLVGLVSAIVCGRVAIALFDRFGDRRTAAGRLCLVAFFWGGGVFALASALFGFLHEAPGVARGSFDVAGWWWFLHRADPVDGWWFLNFGRNLVLPTEAVYHALFFGTMVAVLARRYMLALVLMAVTSMSHPFTGVQLLGIVGAWAFIEMAIVRADPRPPIWFFAGAVALGIAHLAYYLVYLKSFPEHRQLELQWKLPWVLPLPSLILAYATVGSFAFWRLRTPALARAAAAETRNRLLFVWLGVSVLLENHELFIEPVQPIHFTRGYAWTALFLLGLPVLRAAAETLMSTRVRAGRMILVAGFAAFLVADNAVWLGATSAQALGMPLGRNLSADQLRLGFGLTEAQRQLFARLSKPDLNGSVVVSEDDSVGYLLTVYTPLRSWRSHYANTPWSSQRLAELRAFFDNGQVVEAWRTLPIVLVFRNAPPWRQRLEALSDRRPEVVFTNDAYVVTVLRDRIVVTPDSAPAAGALSSHNRGFTARSPETTSYRGATPAIVRPGARAAPE